MVLYIVTVPDMSLVLLRRLGKAAAGKRPHEENVHDGVTIPLRVLLRVPLRAAPVASTGGRPSYLYDCQCVPVDNRLTCLLRPGSMAV
ncbi:hypothetical protein TPA0905_45660 [Streptomyces olivaceus]|nr:hypothetical protein TPA0905_45660 [Streptomyces olivaceus]